MVGHYTAAAVTSGAVPESHIGVNHVWSTYTLSGGTASGSTTIAMCRIPAGARVTGAVLNWNNSDLSTTTGATLCVQTRTGGNVNGAVIATTAISTKPQVFSPAYSMMGYRHTSSSVAVIQFGEFVGTGTLTTIFTLQLSYECSQDGD